MYERGGWNYIMIKKRLMSVLCALSVLVSMFSAIFINVDASQKEEFVKVDGLSLIHIWYRQEPQEPYSVSWERCCA